MSVPALFDTPPQLIGDTMFMVRAFPIPTVSSSSYQKITGTSYILAANIEVLGAFDEVENNPSLRVLALKIAYTFHIIINDDSHMPLYDFLSECPENKLITRLKQWHQLEVIHVIDYFAMNYKSLFPRIGSLDIRISG